MGAETKIQWCHHTFNPWIGCAKVSPGCAHCYAEHDTPARYSRSQGVELWGKDAARRVKAESGWREPLKWDRDAAKAGERRRVFCASQADVFEDREDLESVRDRLFGTMVATPNLDWLLLTKRPENIRPYYERLNNRRRGYWHEHFGYLFGASKLDKSHWSRIVDAYGAPGGPKSLGDSSVSVWPLPNVWQGVSVENQRYADERIPLLLQTPAAVRFVSAEPLLGPIDLAGYFGPQTEGQWLNVVECGFPTSSYGLSWVIAGGESGPQARPCNVAWVRSIVGQCKAAGAPVFVKQLGSNVVCRNDDVSQWFGERGHLSLTPTERFQGAVGRVTGFRDKKGGDISEFPEDLRVREWPR